MVYSRFKVIEVMAILLPPAAISLFATLLSRYAIITPLVTPLVESHEGYPLATPLITPRRHYVISHGH